MLRAEYVNQNRPDLYQPPTPGLPNFKRAVGADLTDLSIMKLRNTFLRSVPVHLLAIGTRYDG